MTYDAIECARIEEPGERRARMTDGHWAADSHSAQVMNSRAGRALRLRGLNARVVEPGRVRRGDTIRKLSSSG